MRNGIGVCLLFALIFGGYWPVSLLALALFFSALMAYFQPGSKFGIPGVIVATALGSLLIFILVLVGINDLIDHDC